MAISKSTDIKSQSTQKSKFGLNSNQDNSAIVKNIDQFNKNVSFGTVNYHHLMTMPQYQQLPDFSSNVRQDVGFMRSQPRLPFGNISGFQRPQFGFKQQPFNMSSSSNYKMI